MEAMQIDVLCARAENGEVRAVVRASSPPTAEIYLKLSFSVAGPVDIWTLARDVALQFLDPA
jgi:hypothetical protein